MTGHIRQFTGRKVATTEPENKEFSLACCAHGCPLVGTISASTKGGSWHCWAHDRLEKAEHWPLLTRWINDNLWLFHAADHLLKMSPYDFDRPGETSRIDARLSARGRDDLRRLMTRPEHARWRTQSEPRVEWAARIRNAAYMEAFDHIRSTHGEAA